MGLTKLLQVVDGVLQLPNLLAGIGSGKSDIFEWLERLVSLTNCCPARLGTGAHKRRACESCADNI